MYTAECVCNMDDFAEKVVLITGSSSGIGAGIAVHFARLKARLSLTGRDVTKLDDVIAKCREAGLQQNDIFMTAGDLADDTFRRHLVQATVDKFGRLDVLVNNAGMVKREDLSEASMDTFDLIMSTNLRNHVAVTKLATPHLIRCKGNVVNISSNLSLRPMPGIGAYCISKAAMDMFTKCLALELAPSGVRVNAVSPGCVRSRVLLRGTIPPEQYESYLQEAAKQHPVGRVGEPEDIARAVAFLASEGSSFITGEILVVDGAGRYNGGSSKVAQSPPARSRPAFSGFGSRKSISVHLGAQAYSSSSRYQRELEL